MTKLPTKPNTNDPRAWPFSVSALAAGLRRYLKDPTVEILNIEGQPIPLQRSSLGKVRGLFVTCKTSQGVTNLDMVVKQAFASSRAGGADSGWRERSLYASMSDYIPIKLPNLVAADPQGEWIILNLLPGGRLAENWEQAEYMLAIEQLAMLHEKFWNLGEDLAIFNWLQRPVDSDVQILLASAEAGLQRLLQTTPGHPLHNELPVFKLLLNNGRIIASRLSELPPTLLHGDFWPGNLIAYPDKTLYVIDWQNAAIGPAILDLVVFVQKSLWQFDKLPTSVERLTAHYRMRIKNAMKVHWADPVWNAYWDHAVMWIFLADWMEVLGRAPVSLIRTHYNDLERVWLAPLRQMTAHWLKEGQQK
jgi:hypothetical protein